MFLFHFVDCLHFICNTVISCAMAFTEFQSTMRKFLFEDQWNANSSDGFGFESLRYVRAARIESTTIMAVKLS
jgi:hypothetical protein